MSDFEKPIREAVIEEAPRLIEMSRKKLTDLMARAPELEQLGSRLKVEFLPGGNVRVKPQDAEATAKLQEVIGTGSAQMSVGEPQVRAPSGVGAPPPESTSNEINPPSPMLGEYPEGSLRSALKTGAVIGGAAAGAAGVYAASGSGTGEESAEGAPQPATDSTPSPADPEPKGIFQSPPAEAPAPTPHTAKTVSAAHMDVPSEHDEILKEIEATAPPKDAKTELTDEDLAKWNDQRSELTRIYKESRATNQWAEVAERVGQALTQFFAAKQGLRSGTNMSGLKFDKTDWFRTQDQLLADLKEDLGIVDTEQGAEEKQVRSMRDAVDKYNSRRDSARSGKAAAQQSTSQFNARSKQDASAANSANDLHAQGLDVQERGQDISASTSLGVAGIGADARAAAAKGKQTPEEKRATALRKASNLLNAMGDIKSKHKDEYLKAASTFAAEAGIPADQWAQWSAEADGDYEVLAQKVTQYAKSQGVSAPAAPAGGATSGGPTRNGKRITGKQQNQGTKQTRYTYEDGTTETVNGLE